MDSISDAGSQDEPPKIPQGRPRDKECPFCRARFTSSSLGRHLDLYIKEKNPRPKDGLHDLDKIREMRRHITRRTFQPSSRRRSSVTADTKPSSRRKSKTYSAGSPIVETAVETSGPSNPPKSMPPTQEALTEPLWQASISSCQSSKRQSLESSPNTSRRPSRHSLLRLDADQRRNAAEELDSLRAAEQALKEVLQAIQDTKENSEEPLFDFDPCELDFPALCLRMLPTPTSMDRLDQPPAEDSCSVSAPGWKQLCALRRQVQQRGLARQRCSRPGLLPLANPDFENVTFAADSEERKVMAHISTVYSRWKDVPDQERQSLWQLELLQSYTKARHAQDVAELALNRLQRAIGSCNASQEPSQSSATQNIGPQTGSPLKQPGNRDRLESVILDMQQWDFDTLVSKHRRTISEKRNSIGGLEAQRPLSALQSLAEDHQDAAFDDAIFHPTLSASTYSRPVIARNLSFGQQTSVSSSGFDDADAEGSERSEPHSVLKASSIRSTQSIPIRPTRPVIQSSLPMFAPLWGSPCNSASPVRSDFMPSLSGGDPPLDMINLHAHRPPLLAPSHLSSSLEIDPMSAPLSAMAIPVPMDGLETTSSFIDGLDMRMTFAASANASFDSS